MVKKYVCEDTREKFDGQVDALKDLGYHKTGAFLKIEADFTSHGRPAFCQLMMKLS